MKKILLLILLILLLPVVTAKTGHLSLLAVSDYKNHIGSIADLYLTIEPGQGRVFLDTFPLTQIDTQMSTRMAKQIACDFLEKDCSNKDFFYTIRAKSAIVGGPSAGSALAALTVAMLENLEVDESIVVTGSINSGGIIGPVGGIETKIIVAEKNNFTKVLIPNTAFRPQNATNFTNTSIRVVEVSNLAEVVYEFTGKRYEDSDQELDIDDSYLNIMKDVTDIICQRTNQLLGELSEDQKKDILFETAINMTIASDTALNISAYYPAASYCFRANINLRHLLNKGINEKETLMAFNDLKFDIKEFEIEIEQKEIQTIADLQTKIIVKERLMDSKEYIEKGIKQLDNNNSIYALSYARERFFSAISWSKFFGMDGKKIKLNKEILQASCINKIAEAEERHQYVLTILPLSNSSRNDLDQAMIYLKEEEYEMCLFKASKTKADLDVMLSVMGITEEGLTTLIDEKLKVAKEQISKEIKRGFFPIMGYSYYLYSEDLKYTEPISSVIYAEFALELSNMRPYFTSPSAIGFSKPIISKEFLIGCLVGFLLALPMIVLFKRKK